jgi:hypothetical protein
MTPSNRSVDDASDVGRAGVPTQLVGPPAFFETITGAGRKAGQEARPTS